jgi:arylsulfatase
VTVPDSGAEGVIVAQGGRHGGFTLYIKNGRLVYETSAYGQLSGSLESSMTLTPGKVEVVVEVTPVPNNEAPGGFRRSFPMKARLIINGKVDREISIRTASDNDTLDIGSDLVSPVSPKYACPFEFTGKIDSVTIDLL